MFTVFKLWHLICLKNICFQIIIPNWKHVVIWIFSVCAPKFFMHPQVTDHVSLHSKSLSKIIARASGGANNMHPISRGGTNGKDPIILTWNNCDDCTQEHLCVTFQKKFCQFLLCRITYDFIVNIFALC